MHCGHGYGWLLPFALSKLEVETQPPAWQWTMEWEAVIHILCWIASRGDSQTTRAIILIDSMSLLQKVKSGMGSPDWNVSMVDIHLWKLLWVYCPGHAGVNGNAKHCRLAGKSTLTSGLFLGRSEVLRSLRHYMQAQSQGHHNIDHLEDRGMERESTRQSRHKIGISKFNKYFACQCDICHSIRWWKWFIETSQTITVTSQIHCSLWILLLVLLLLEL